MASEVQTRLNCELAEKPTVETLISKKNRESARLNIDLVQNKMPPAVMCLQLIVKTMQTSLYLVSHASDVQRNLTARLINLYVFLFVLVGRRTIRSQ